MKDNNKPTSTYNFDVDFSYVPEFKEGKVNKEEKDKKQNKPDNVKEENNE